MEETNSVTPTTHPVITFDFYNHLKEMEKSIRSRPDDYEFQHATEDDMHMYFITNLWQMQALELQMCVDLIMVVREIPFDRKFA